MASLYNVLHEIVHPRPPPSTTPYPVPEPVHRDTRFSIHEPCAVRCSHARQRYMPNLHSIHFLPSQTNHLPATSADSAIPSLSSLNICILVPNGGAIGMDES